MTAPGPPAVGERLVFERRPVPVSPPGEILDVGPLLLGWIIGRVDQFDPLIVRGLRSVRFGAGPAPGDVVVGSATVLEARPVRDRWILRLATRACTASGGLIAEGEVEVLASVPPAPPGEPAAADPLLVRGEARRG